MGGDDTLAAEKPVGSCRARPIQEIVLSDLIGVERIVTIAITPDGKVTTYSFQRRRSQLFVVRDLRYASNLG